MRRVRTAQCAHLEISSCRSRGVSRPERATRARETLLAGGAALDPFAEPPLDVLLGRVRQDLLALAEAAVVLGPGRRLVRDAAGEVGLQLLFGCVPLLVEAFGEALVDLLGARRVLVLGALDGVVFCGAPWVVVVHR